MSNRWCINILLQLWLILSSVTLAGSSSKDPQVFLLGKEVHGKGWIVYSARTENGDWDLFLIRPDSASPGPSRQSTKSA